MNLECKQCKCTFTSEGARGRTPSFCSNACRQRAYRERRRARVGVPEEMVSSRRWVRCDERKRPVSASGALLLWSGADTWMSHSKALSAPYGAGLGYVLGEGIGVIDLDDCVRPDGSLSSLARGILEENPGAYVERSQSGRGLHVFGRISGNVCVRDAGLEVYAGDRKRFVWVTGDVFRAGGLPALSW